MVVRLVQGQAALLWGINVCLLTLCISTLSDTMILLVPLLIGFNLLTAVLCFWDKRRACAGSNHRISENALLLSSFSGANILLPASMYAFSHKTTKLSFNVKMLVSLFIQSILLGMWFIFVFIKR
ncbi:DUF1294 domain-containing protein (plasmid) [Pseudoalteromonas sp. T1lg65]|uniref:DUF1294 domain-containing protein n=1 Tax=Pseudoalteromonas sp. T1lg65 TaxID=2077101 RepID=UPI003F78C075